MTPTELFERARVRLHIIPREGLGELVLPRLRERGLLPEPAGPTLRERMRERPGARLV